MIQACLLLGLVSVLMAAARSFLPAETVVVGSGATLAFGFVLLAALQAGTLVSGVRLPRLTGYLALGFLAGPSGLGLLSGRMVMELKLVNGVAIGLIALLAGSELNIRRLRQVLGTVLRATSASLACSMVVLTLALFALSGLLPFAEGMSVPERLVLALTLAVVLSALSPTVTIALLGETGAAGPFSEMALCLVIVADLVIVVSFAGTKAIATMVFATGESSGVGPLLMHIFGSLAVGVVIGVVLLLYVRKVREKLALFAVGVCFLCAEAGTKLHLDPLLMCLAAGIFLENLTEVAGKELATELGPAILPVFAVFFAVAGAGLHLDVLFDASGHVLWATVMMILLLLLLRGGSLMLGCRLGVAGSAVSPAVKRYLPYATLSQSGVAIGLATLVERHFPGWGKGASTLLLGVIMLNEMIGPVLFRRALLQSGEATHAGGRGEH